MRIAQIAPIWETIPPRFYGGTELVVNLLTEELIRMGHEVVLFAAGGSKTSARLVAGSDFPLRELPEKLPQYADQAHSLYPGSQISAFYELKMLQHVFNMADQFDVIHNHLGFMALPFASLSKTPVVTTLHGAFKTDTLATFCETQFFKSFPTLPMVSISDYQRKPCPNLNYAGTVYHGLDVKKYYPSFTYGDKHYLAFLGRFCEEKGPHHAIRAAKETGWKLIMAGKVDCDDEQQFFKTQIEPHIDGDQIQYIGELDHPRKVALLQNAAATLCPVTWPEPFGLVLIESLACGTPVLAMRHGSIPEIIAHGQTGFVSDTVEELISHIRQIPQIDRRICRSHVETRFSVQRMTSDYVAIYQQLAAA